MGFLNWLRGDTTRKTEDHAVSSGYSFFFGATSSGRPVTEALRDADDCRVFMRADFG